MDIDDAAQLAAALAGTDLLLHCAGPFQRKVGCAVLEACLEQGTPYMDVCDDTDYSARARTYHDRAQAAGVPAITTAGAPLLPRACCISSCLAPTRANCWRDAGESSAKRVHDKLVSRCCGWTSKHGQGYAVRLRGTGLLQVTNHESVALKKALCMSLQASTRASPT